MASQRVRATIPKSLTEIWHDVISIAVICVLILYVGLLWTNVQDIIPIHFNVAGEVDGWGSKYLMLFLPATNLLIFSLLSMISRYPHTFSYPVEITEVNVQEKYGLARMMLSWLKLEITLLSSYVEWSMMQVALGERMGLGSWFLPVSFIAVFGTIGWYFYRLMRK
ncbi:hypothetical protein BVG16_23010 [Paenibacillus selenitireducens]|uniref:DUF1648 domain-containing protein n=1 Tax=Paenibacillus selenitireducens TaxID=1324314 RepID=A0A1T2X459_9BACL|nr:DUF1648 domain-containing protein [Paenibacillus selenitireducens]OPA74632.1 hypothetical protein BVG16_23010 [Paenibacillus selenitireducens]